MLTYLKHLIVVLFSLSSQAFCWLMANIWKGHCRFPPSITASRESSLRVDELRGGRSVVTELSRQGDARSNCWFNAVLVFGTIKQCKATQ